jgi:peptidyl-prolyl cis-trans isomerase A (cyclophilin A)
MRVLLPFTIAAGLALGGGCKRGGPDPRAEAKARAEARVEAKKEGGGARKDPTRGAGGEGTPGERAAAGDGGAAAAPTDDPKAGTFPLEEALEGLGGKGALLATIEFGPASGKAAGKLTCELYEASAPTTVANFVGLARGLRPFKDPVSRAWEKRPFYDGLLCHRVIPSFVAHCGDPTGKGGGDPGYTLPVEVTPDLAFDRPGRLAMSNRNTDGRVGSQFFMTEKAAPWLNGRHAIFGQCAPVSLIEKLTHVAVDSPMNNRPVEDLAIKKVTILRGKPPKR